MNFVACRYARKKDLTYIRNDAFELPLPDNAWQGIADGRELILGIRPEDIYEDESYRSKFPEWTMRATVNVVEPLGNETFLHLNLGNSKAVLRASNKKQFRPGDLILVTIDLPNAHLFDAKSEIQLRRI
jgi:multiple sugar transport system ATP-binding protein